MSDPVYCYPPDHNVLRNKHGIRTAAELNATEREFSTFRMQQGCPTGDFDLNHLKAIHKHVFRDTYDWAGSVRKVEINKGGSQFMLRQFIETGMADVHRRIIAADYLKGTNPRVFAEQAGRIIGDVNHVHPFREGNGRTQLCYLSQLANCAGHQIDLQKLDPTAWVEASIDANIARYEKMQRCIEGALVHPELDKKSTDAQKQRLEEIRKSVMSKSEPSVKERSTGIERD
jgi:cell filamentation protein